MLFLSKQKETDVPVLVVHMKGDPEGEMREIVCPKAEYLVLIVLCNDKLTAPEIARRSETRLTIASTYKLLHRLQERGIVCREDVVVDVMGALLNRVVNSVAFDRVQGGHDLRGITLPSVWTTQR